MKIAAVEPFSERYSFEDDLERVTEDIKAEEGETQPVNTNLSSSPENTEENEVRQGFVRLADFLAQKNKKAQSLPSTMDSLRLKMIQSYQRAASSTKQAPAKGQLINRLL